MQILKNEYILNRLKNIVEFLNVFFEIVGLFSILLDISI